MPSKRIGPYEILHVLGRGGMGAVYLAHAPDGTPVAVKTLATLLAPEPAALARFAQEAEILARLDHPHVVRALGPLARDGDTHYFPMEFVPGKSLAEVLRQVGRLDVGRAVALLRQVADALGAAHRAGVIHRDLKPSNILVDTRDVAKVTDFGVARAVNLTRLTLTGQLVGTPAYLPPELIEGKDPDARSDLYSLGVVAYEVLTGRLPFTADSPLALLRQHAEQAPPPLETIDPGLPELLRALVHRCLEKDPARRYESAAALLVDLECVHVAPPDRALGDRIQTFVARETVKLEAHLADSRTWRRKRWLFAGVAAGLLLAAAAGAFAWTRYLRPYFYDASAPSPSPAAAVEGRGGGASADPNAPAPPASPARLATLVLRDGTRLRGSRIGIHPLTGEILFTDESGRSRTWPPTEVKEYYPPGETPEAVLGAGDGR